MNYPPKMYLVFYTGNLLVSLWPLFSLTKLGPGVTIAKASILTRQTIPNDLTPVRPRLSMSGTQTQAIGLRQLPPSGVRCTLSSASWLKGRLPTHLSAVFVPF